VEGETQHVNRKPFKKSGMMNAEKIKILNEAQIFDIGFYYYI